MRIKDQKHVLCTESLFCLLGDLSLKSTFSYDFKQCPPKNINHIKTELISSPSHLKLQLLIPPKHYWINKINTQKKFTPKSTSICVWNFITHHNHHTLTTNEANDSNR